MVLRIIRAEQFIRQPWKNGGGTTEELLRFPSGSGDDWLLRLSIADVTASGPFSRFPGCQRTIIQLAGAPMVLSHRSGDGQAAWPHRLGVLDPYDFDGDWSTDCQVSGPCRDFNVIRKTSAISCQTRVVRLAAGVALDTVGVSGTLVVYCLSGGFQWCDSTGSRSQDLRSHELLVADTDDDGHLPLLRATEESTRAIVIDVSFLSP